MKIDILTLFPEMFRDYSKDPHNKVDDTPYGGGCGMVLMIQPIYDCLEAIKTNESKIIMLTPDGQTFKQSLAYKLSNCKHLILLCGHYEGFDERIRSLVDLEISIGDYVLTGGETASMVITDAITRLIPGVIEEESHLNESFNNNLLDYPQYTKPRVFNNMEVPEVLLSGNHQKIKEYREQIQKERTLIRRSDLLQK